MDMYLQQTINDEVLEELNNKFMIGNKTPQKIGLVYVGSQSPGGNNIVDGLLRYQKQRENVELIGFVNGL
jgi:hypothetical protein